MALFRLEHLSFTYPDAAQPALRDLTLTLQPGEFVILCGASGSGKSTLLRQLKPVLQPHGTREGQILFQDAPLEELPPREQAARIGFVLQNPDSQLVTDRVWHELAFGLESLGMDTASIRRRVAEMSAYFGITDWFDREVQTLSGGQKQLLNLAAVMAMSPDILILDEPTSQLDPIAAGEFLDTLARLNRELGTTILLSEHRLEAALPLSSRVWVMDGGRLLADGTAQEVGRQLIVSGHRMFESMPAAMRIWAAVDGSGDCPVTVREGRDWLAERPLRPLPAEPQRNPGSPTVQLSNVWFRYEKNAPDVLTGLTLQAYPGQLLCLMGGNGAGKSTAMQIIAGVRTPQRGRVEVKGRVALLPQNPSALFTAATVRQELEAMCAGSPERAKAMAQRFDLAPLYERNPLDLSGGEQQRVGLAKLMLTEPDILLLDEPTKGVDSAFARRLRRDLRALLAEGKTIVLVSHDTAFCAACADRCGMLFRGEMTAEGTPRAFFAGNNFYTTAANRIARQRLPEAITPEDVIAACGGSVPEADALPRDLPFPEPKQTREAPPLSKRRKGCALLGGLLLLAGMLWSLRGANLTDLLRGAGQRALDGAIPGYLMVLAGLLLLGWALHRPGQQLPEIRAMQSKRTWVALAVILLLVPLTLWLGHGILSDRRYALISVLVLLETMLPLLLAFESRKPKARELVLLAVLCALGVLGRAAFAMLPSFKPVLALTILVGYALGAEAGFVTGSMTMLASGLVFGQGPWTAWQMFAAGLVGFLGGVLFRSGRLRRSRAALSLMGFLLALLLYGPILNLSTVVQEYGTPTAAQYLLALATGFPMDLVHGVSTAVFLWLFSGTVLEKLLRVQTKYGLYEPKRSTNDAD